MGLVLIIGEGNTTRNLVVSTRLLQTLVASLFPFLMISVFPSRVHLSSLIPTILGLVVLYYKLSPGQYIPCALSNLSFLLQEKRIMIRIDGKLKGILCSN